MAVFVISDIHGRYEEFLELLLYSKIDIKNGDILINLGDMVNRGKDSASVVEWFRKKNILYPNNVIVLYGNHEDILLSRIKGKVNDDIFFNKKIGGKLTQESYNKTYGGFPDEHISFINNLPTYYIMDNYIFFHAGIDLTKRIDCQPFKNIIWDQDRFYTQDTSMFENIFVFGHTPTEYINQYYGTKGSEIWKQENKICVDCTYSKSRKLLLYNLTDDIEYYYSFAMKKCYKK